MFPDGMIKCSEVLLCVKEEPCETCSGESGQIFGTPPALVKGRYYRAEARTPDDHPVRAWWIPELDPQPVLMMCDCGEGHVGMGWLLRCATHFGSVTDEHDSELVRRIKSAKPTAPRATPPPVKVPDLEEV